MTTDFGKKQKQSNLFENSFQDFKLAHYLRTYRVFDFLKWIPHKTILDKGENILFIADEMQCVSITGGSSGPITRHTIQKMPDY